MRIIILVLSLLVSSSIFAQKENKTIRKGNSNYDAAKYDIAETNYRKSLEINPQSFPANNNLGNAMYRQEKFDESAKQFLQSSVVNDDKVNKADSYYNYGNSLFKGKKLKESIEAYKNALRLNPKDEEARYNLAYAQKLLSKQQQNQQQQGDKQNKDNQDQDQKQNQDQQKKEGENKEQQEQAKQEEGKEGDKKEQQGQQAKEEKISKEDAERILQALKNDEMDLQKKLSVKKGKRISIEKDW